jgi:hypothetical protein
MEKRLNLMEILDSPRLRSKEEIWQQAEYYLVKTAQMSFLDFSCDEIDKILDVAEIINKKMEKKYEQTLSKN